jgi:vancomycin resistance protein VanJ
VTVERYRDEPGPTAFRAETEELPAAPLLPRQRRLELPPAAPAGPPWPSLRLGLAADGQAPPDSEPASGPLYRSYGSEPASGSGSAPEPAAGPGPAAETEAEAGYRGEPPAEPIAEDPDQGDEPPAGQGPTSRGPDLPSPRHKPWPSPRQQVATAIMVLCTLITLFLLGHRYLPSARGALSLLESWLPWLAIPIGVLLLGAVAVRRPRALIAAGVAAAVWLAGYGPALLPRGGGLPAQLRVYSVDVNGLSGELSRAGTMAIAQQADMVALEDVYGDLGGSSAEAKLNAAYPANHVTQYEFGVWSKYPIVDSTPIDLGTTTASGTDTGQALVADGTSQQVFGALRVTIATPEGDLVAYVVHIPQPVLNDNGFAIARDAAVKRLAAVVSADKAAKLIVVGDVNVAATDRQFSVLQQDLGLTSAQSSAGRGFGFTWPAEFPAVRLDDLLSRSGVTAVRSVVMPSIGTGKTHLPIEVDLNL